MNAISRTEFYRGLLYALRARCDHFLSHGPRYHDAFEAALRSQALRSDTHPALGKIVMDLLEELDPVFGVYQGAGEMVLEGMGALILTLDAPRFEVARFKLSQADAFDELRELAHADAYRRMAEALHDALRRKGGV